MSEGNPAAQSITYPLAPLDYSKVESSYNLLMIVVDGLGNEDLPSYLACNNLLIITSLSLSTIQPA